MQELQGDLPLRSVSTCIDGCIVGKNILSCTVAITTWKNVSKGLATSVHMRVYFQKPILPIQL
jgi:hypothetical protein